MRPVHHAAAARLLLARHADARRHEPLLPPLDAAAAHALVANPLAVPRGIGWVAVAGGRVLGFLVAVPSAPVLGVARSVLVPAAGHAVVPDGTDAVRCALHARLAATRACDHHVQVGAHDAAALAAWARLGFAELLAVAVAPLPVRVAAVSGVAIHQATAADLDAMVALARVQQAHHAAPPMGLPPPAGGDREERTCQQRLLDDPRTGVWIARAGSTAVGMLVLRPPGGAFSALHLPADTVHLPDAVVVPAARGRGVGSALLAEALGWAHVIGYRHVALHVHAANAPGRRFWAARGFRTVAYQLVRPAGVTG